VTLLAFAERLRIALLRLLQRVGGPAHRESGGRRARTRARTRGAAQVALLAPHAGPRDVSSKVSKASK